MINLLWFAMIAVAFVTAAVTGRMETFTDAHFFSGAGCQRCFSMVSMMILVRMMKIIEKRFIHYCQTAAPLSRLLFLGCRVITRPACHFDEYERQFSAWAMLLSLRTCRSCRP